MNLAIYANGGESIGYGHLMRTGTLAEKFIDRGHHVEYLTTTPGATRDVVPDKSVVTAIEGPRTVAHRIPSRIDVLLTDSYDLDYDLQQQLSHAAPRLAVIMDRNRYSLCCDILINGNLYAPDLRYEWTGSEPRWCLGPECLLLRDEIREYAKKEPPWREIPERALITMGGSDIQNLTPTILQAFDGLDLRLDVIVGPGFSERQERDIRDVVSNVSGDVRVACDPEDLAGRMFDADFAVTTASSTTYELMALGTPIVSIPVTDNQEPIAAALRERDAATVLDSGADVPTIRDAIQTYMTEPSLRRRRRKYGRNLVDGQGAERVCTKILSLVDENTTT